MIVSLLISNLLTIVSNRILEVDATDQSRALLDVVKSTTPNAVSVRSDANTSKFEHFILEMKGKNLMLTGSPSVHVLAIREENVGAAEQCAAAYELHAIVVFGQKCENKSSSSSWMVVGKSLEEVESVSNELKHLCDQSHGRFGVVAATTIAAVLVTWTGLAMA